MITKKWLNGNPYTHYELKNNDMYGVAFDAKSCANGQLRGWVSQIANNKHYMILLN